MKALAIRTGQYLAIALTMVLLTWGYMAFTYHVLGVEKHPYTDPIEWRT